MSELDKEQYWMVTGRWFEMVNSASQIMVPGGHAPSTTIVEKYKTEFINSHPAKYCILMQRERPMYALVLATPNYSSDV